MRPAAIALLLVLGALAGCATPLQIPREVKVPDPVPCLDTKDRPARPAILSSAELLLLSRYDRTLQLWIDHELLRGYTVKLEAIAERCSQLGPIKPAGP